MLKKILILITIALFSCSCSSSYKDAAAIGEEPDIYPDYAGIILPYNISPMNFLVNNDGDRFIVELKGGGSSLKLRGPKVRIPENKWRNILEESKGKTIRFCIYVKRQGEWKKLNDIVNAVSSDPIDNYVTYRLIEPGYSGYSKIVLRQRDLTSFKENDLYNSHLISGRIDQQCINCHSFQNFNADRFQLHARQTKGGTVIAEGNKSKKLAFKTGDLISNAVYPSWHPHENLIAYSVNSTEQLFHMKNRQKIEVYDNASDLILYDVDTDEVTYIVNDSLSYETFPYWSQDGRTLYYASAYLPSFGADSSTEAKRITERIRYNIYSVSFNPEDRTFGTPTLVLDAVKDSLSAVTPRPSPDGKYLLSGVGDYGSFHIWHESGDIYLTDLSTGETRPLNEINSPRADSFKCWSSNSRWIIFTSRRDDGNYTRLYITYFDENGKAGKPFMLPQKDPYQNLRLFKSYNVPELTKDKTTLGPKDIERILLSEPIQVEQI